MALRLEGEEEIDLEQRVERLENTLRAVTRETDAVTLRGPCSKCAKCLMIQTNEGLHCPNCGDGGPI